MRAARGGLRRELPKVMEHLAGIFLELRVGAPEGRRRGEATEASMSWGEERPSGPQAALCTALFTSPPSLLPGLGVDLDDFLPSWLRSLFSSTLNLDTAARVFDCYLRDGEPLIWQVESYSRSRSGFVF